MTEDEVPPEGAETQEVDAGIDGSVEVATLRAQLAELERKNAFLADGYVAAKKPHWVAEQTRLNPELTTLLGKEAFAGIEAKSRREFARQVEGLAEIHAPTIGRLKALREEAGATVEEIRARAHEEARAEVAAAWGKPSGDTLPPMAAKDKSKDTASTLQALIDQ